MVLVNPICMGYEFLSQRIFIALATGYQQTFTAQEFVESMPDAFWNLKIAGLQKAKKQNKLVPYIAMVLVSHQSRFPECFIGEILSYKAVTVEMAVNMRFTSSGLPPSNIPIVSKYISLKDFPEVIKEMKLYSSIDKMRNSITEPNNWLQLYCRQISGAVYGLPQLEQFWRDIQKIVGKKSKDKKGLTNFLHRKQSLRPYLVRVNQGFYRFQDPETERKKEKAQMKKSTSQVASTATSKSLCTNQPIFQEQTALVQLNIETVELVSFLRYARKLGIFDAVLPAALKVITKGNLSASEIMNKVFAEVK